MIPNLNIQDHFSMATSKEKVVNLDALIQRSDLLVPRKGEDATRGNNKEIQSIYVDHLKIGTPFFSTLRKPDFQRETSGWSPAQIKLLIENLLDTKLIPALILWRSPSNEIFVVDGAHRLSVFIAWVNNDYGFGDISQSFWGKHNISYGQQQMDLETRELINSTVGSYQRLLEINQNRNAEAGAEDKRRANAMGNVTLQTQTLTESVEGVADAFVRINQGGVKINTTEAAIIRKRDQPEGIAARAMLRAGAGFPYWRNCPPKAKAEIISLAKQIDALLYEPEDVNDEVFAAIPMAGKRYTSDALDFLFHLIEVANSLTKAASAEKPVKKQRLPKRDLGLTTVKYMARIRDLLQIVFSKRPKSLGLHPAVYCRSATGRFQAAAFYAQIQFVQYLEEQPEGFHKFTKIRKAFEDFLVENKSILNEIVRGKGSSLKSLKSITSIYVELYRRLLNGESTRDISKAIFKNKEFKKYLTHKTAHGVGGFTSEANAAIKMKSELEHAPECPECHARMHLAATTSGHIVAKEEMGSSHSDNGRPMHPFCNSGVEERRRSKSKRATAIPADQPL